MSTGLKFHKTPIAFLLTTDFETKRLHHQFMGKNVTTDVITFVAGSPLPRGERVAPVDVIISLDQAARQAKTRGLKLSHEVLLLMCHAMLHAKGFNDLTTEGAMKMRQQEFEWLARIL